MNIKLFDGMMMSVCMFVDVELKESNVICVGVRTDDSIWR